jgi:DNA polymerase V
MNSMLRPMSPVLAASEPMLVQYLENQVCAGFPSPAEDLGAQRIDLASLLGTEREDTYFMRVSGQSMMDLGIFNNDIVIVSRGRRPRDGHIVVATVDGEFTVKQLYKKFGKIKLKAANPTFPDIVPKDGQTITVWGVVTGSIKLFPA